MSFMVYLWTSHEEGDKCFARLTVECGSIDDLWPIANALALDLGAHSHGFSEEHVPGFVDGVNRQ